MFRPALISLVIWSFAFSAGATCKAFLHLKEGAEPTSVDCGDAAKNMDECKKLCASAARKKCPQKGTSLQADVNFSMPASGFAADSVRIRCK